MKSLFTIIFFSLSLFVYGQETDYLKEMYDEHHAIQQKEGTSEILKNYVAAFSKGEKELFAILFTPQACPRCESDINYLLDHINIVRPEAKIILIAAYPDPELAQNYLQQFHTKNIIIDTNNKHEQIFHYRAGKLGVCYFLRIDMEKGRLICGGSSPTLNIDFLDQFCHNTTYMPLFAENKELMPHLDIRRPSVLNGTYKSIFMKANNKMSISEVLGTLQWHENSFLYVDELASKGRLFSIKNDTAYLEKDIYLTEKQEKTFVQISDSTYHNMKKKGYICIMANSCAFTPNTKQATVSFSIPRLFRREGDKVAYYNHNAFLSIQEGNPTSNFFTLDFELNNNPIYMYIHTFPFYPIDERYVIIACQKGYPITAELNELSDGDMSIDKNIFLPEFYNNSPFCAIFDKQTGKVVKYLGKLDNIFKTNKIGYYFTTPVAGIYHDTLVYGDGFSGKLWITNTHNYDIGSMIKVHDVIIKNSSKKDSLLYTEDYFETFFQDFNKQIMEIKLNSEGIHCLIREGKSAEKDKNDLYEYRLLGYDGKLKNKFPLIIEKGDNVLSFGLGKNTNKEIFPFYFCKNSKGCFLKYITPNISSM